MDLITVLRQLPLIMTALGSRSGSNATNFVRETLPPGGLCPNLLLIEVASLRFAELAPPNTTFARPSGVHQTYFPRDLSVFAETHNLTRGLLEAARRRGYSMLFRIFYNGCNQIQPLVTFIHS